MCVAIIIAIGVMMALEPVFNYRTPVWLSVVLPDVVTVIIAVCTGKKSHCLLFFTAIVYALAVFFLFRENAFEWAAGFFTWWYEKLDQDSVYWTAKNIFFVRLIVTFGVSCASYFLVRRIRSFYLLVLAEVSFFTALFALDFSPPPPAMLLLAGGAALVLVQDNLRRIYVSGSNVRVSRRSSFITASALLLIVITIAVNVIPEDVSAWRTNFIADLFDDTFSTDLNGRIGDPLRPNNNAVMYVAAKDRLLMKDSAYTTYSVRERTWRHAETRIQYGTPGTEVASGVGLPAQPATGTAVVHYVGSGSLSLFYAWRPVALRFRGGSDTVLSLADSGMIVRDGQLTTGETYDFDYEVTDSQTLKTATDLFPDFGGSDPTAGYAGLVPVEDYLEVPGEVSNAISGLVLSLTNDIITRGGTSAELAFALYGHFADGYRYSLSPPVPPMGTDLVSYLLTSSKTGYCAHFATALCMMAREAGIPARYVTGYALTPSAENPPYNYVARNSTAHAWAELYISGMGWVTFDPTALVAASPTFRPIEIPEPTPTPTPTPTPNPTPTPTTTPTPTANPNAPQSDKFTLHPLAKIAIITVVCAAVVFAALSALRRRRRGKYTDGALRAKYPNPIDRLSALDRHCQTALSVLRLTRNAGETALRFAQRASARLDAPDDSLEALCRLVMRNAFGRQPPSDGEVAELAASCAWVDDAVREKLSKPRLFMYETFRY
jgi:transglutaminase-like putative cysteine protease